MSGVSNNSNDLTSYLLGERSELRPLLEAIARTKESAPQARAAVEYLLVLAGARYAATGRPPETSALSQIRGQYQATFVRDQSEHARLLTELQSSLRRNSITGATTALKLLGLFHRRNGQYRLARASFAVAAELAGRADEPIERLNSLFWLGIAERYLGNLDVAEAVHRDQMSLARRTGEKAQVVLARANLGLVALRRGEIGEARSLVLRALNEAQQLENRELEGQCYHTLMMVETSASRPGEAAACGWEAYQLYESNELRVRALRDCGTLLFEAGLYDAARAAYEIVLQGATYSPDRIYAKIGLADVLAAKGERARFEEMAMDLLSEEALPEMPYELNRAYYSLGLGYATLGDAATAEDYLRRSLRIAEERGFGAEAEEAREHLSTIVEEPPAVLQPLRPVDSEYERLKNVGRNIIEERARLSA